MRASCRFSVLRRGFFAAFALVVLDTTILREGVGSVYGFLLSDSSSIIFSHHCAIVEKNVCQVQRLHSSIHPLELSDFEDQQREHRQPQVVQSRDVFLRTIRLASIATIVANPVTKVEAFEGGVGGLGKTKPETGVELFDETSAPIQNEKGIVSSEIKGKDGSPIFVAFRTPWPLLPTSGALEARDIRSTESAFVQVTSLASTRSGDQKWKAKKEFEKVLMDSVFAAQGKFGAYGQPYDIQAKKVTGEADDNDTKPTLFSVGFTTLTPAMRESERRALIAAKQVGADTLVLLVVTTTSARYASNEKTFNAVASSFEAIAAPESGLNKNRSSK